MIILPILANALIHFLFKRFGECTFWTVKDLNSMSTSQRSSTEGHESTRLLGKGFGHQRGILSRVGHSIVAICDSCPTSQVLCTISVSWVARFSFRTFLRLTCFWSYLMIGKSTILSGFSNDRVESTPAGPASSTQPLRISSEEGRHSSGYLDGQPDNKWTDQ